MHVIGTAGHVDHGKSALVERLTGIDPDRFAEEKRRGLTIDLGFAWMTLPSGREVGVIDVPGHERFVRNMLAGAGGITTTLFVVAANEGWMPQSAEHLAILDLLGVPGVIALTKSDTVSADDLEVVMHEVRARVGGTVLQDAPIVACSAMTGAGLDELVAAVDEAIAHAPGAVDGGRPRLWIDRVFTIAGAGTVVTGTLTGGSLVVGDTVEIAPEGRVARVRGIQNHKHAVAQIDPGKRVALNLAGLDRDGAQRGDAVVERGDWRGTRTIDVRLQVVRASSLMKGHEVTEKGSYLLHVGSAETPVRVKLLDATRVAPGERAYAELQLQRALPLARHDRFVLRDAGRGITVGGGEVLDPFPRQLRGDRTSRARLLAAMDGDDLDALAAVVAEERQVTRAEALLRFSLSAPNDALRVPLGTHGRSATVSVVELAGTIVTRDRLEALRAQVRAALAVHHAEHPLDRGVPLERVRGALDLGDEAFGALLSETPEVVVEGPLLRLESHTVALSPQQHAERDRLLAALEANAFTPPLTKELNVDVALVRSLVDAGDVVRIGDFMLTARQAAEARRIVRARLEENGGLTVAEIRDLLGTTRKYAVPLCEWLDQTGATLRRGDLRLLGPKE